MTRTFFYTAMTLDGFLADEQDSLAWLFKQDIDQEGPYNYGAFRAGLGAGCLGATTYEWLLEHEESEWSWTLPLFVFTHRDLPVMDNVTLVRGDVREVHARMAEVADGKDLWMMGGGDLAAQFAEAGLLDELLVQIAPVTLGAGRPLFPRRWDLRLLDFDRNRDFLCARYEVVGPLADE